MMSQFEPNWIRLAPNGTNPGLFQIRFQNILAQSHLVPIWPILGPKVPDLSHFAVNPSSLFTRWRHIGGARSTTGMLYFSTKCVKIDLKYNLKKTRICPNLWPIWPSLEPNLTSTSLVPPASGINGSQVRPWPLEMPQKPSRWFRAVITWCIHPIVTWLVNHVTGVLSLLTSSHLE